MLSFVIGDSVMVTGFRLVGIDGEEVATLDQARSALLKSFLRRDLGIIMVSEEFSPGIRKDIDQMRAERISPIILEVPGRSGPSGKIKMSEVISKTLGIRI